MRQSIPQRGANPVERAFETELEPRISEAIAARIGGSILFRIGTARSETWRLDSQAATPPRFTRSEAPADCTFIVPDIAAWTQIVTGKLSATTALAQGKLTVEGDLTVGMRFEQLVLAR